MFSIVTSDHNSYITIGYNIGNKIAPKRFFQRLKKKLLTPAEEYQKRVNLIHVKL